MDIEYEPERLEMAKYALNIFLHKFPFLKFSFNTELDDNVFFLPFKNSVKGICISFRIPNKILVIESDVFNNFNEKTIVFYNTLDDVIALYNRKNLIY